MEKEIQDIIQASSQRFLSSSEQKQLLNYLKSISEFEAYEIIKDMLETKSNIHLKTVKSVLNQKEYVVKLFRYGLLTCNAQSIKLWLEFAIPKLGLKAVIYLIEELDDNSNQLAEIALYWLPSLISENSIKSLKLIERLEHKVKERHEMSDKP
jgi:hypothetical protein